MSQVNYSLPDQRRARRLSWGYFFVPRARR
jgi:hypothetical protein